MNMEAYLSGEQLYGNDFDFEQIKKWYEEEAEGYANLGSSDKANYDYAYHEINKIHGFKYLPKDRQFEHALGFGSAYGYELLPVLDKISKMTIIEPSDNLVSEQLGHLKPIYVKPKIEGDLPFNNDEFDLITCLGVLHHIPNVSFVLNELIRVLKPGGYLLLREPIISMGDWRHPRPGLTKHERGIPVAIFDKTLNEAGVKVISKNYCFTMTSFIQRTIGKAIKGPIFKHKPYAAIDKLMSKLTKGNLHYHATSPLQRIAPTAVYYVISK